MSFGLKRLHQFIVSINKTHGKMTILHSMAEFSRLENKNFTPRSLKSKPLKEVG